MELASGGRRFLCLDKLEPFCRWDTSLDLRKPWPWPSRAVSISMGPGWRGDPVSRPHEHCVDGCEVANGAHAGSRVKATMEAAQRFLRWAEGSSVRIGARYTVWIMNLADGKTRAERRAGPKRFSKGELDGGPRRIRHQDRVLVVSEFFSHFVSRRSPISKWTMRKVRNTRWSILPLQREKRRGALSVRHGSSNPIVSLFLWTSLSGGGTSREDIEETISTIPRVNGSRDSTISPLSVSSHTKTALAL